MVQRSSPRTKRPSRRKHFIPELAARVPISQAEIATKTGANKATVFRWFKGNMPQDHYLDALVTCLGIEDRSAIFRHPDEDRIIRFFRALTPEERQRFWTMIEAAFPK
jgi:transcriptional regulator with XRE-family HTH domain